MHRARGACFQRRVAASSARRRPSRAANSVLPAGRILFAVLLFPHRDLMRQASRMPASEASRRPPFPPERPEAPRAGRIAFAISRHPLRSAPHRNRILTVHSLERSRRVAPDGAPHGARTATPVTSALRRAPRGAVRRQDPPERRRMRSPTAETKGVSDSATNALLAMSRRFAPPLTSLARGQGSAGPRPIDRSLSPQTCR